MECIVPSEKPTVPLDKASDDVPDLSMPATGVALATLCGKSRVVSPLRATVFAKARVLDWGGVLAAEDAWLLGEMEFASEDERDEIELVGML